MTLNRSFIVALMCGTFISAAPAFAGGILGGGVGGAIGGGGALNVPSLPAPVASGRAVADVGVNANVNTRVATDTVVGTVATLRGAADAAKGTAHKGVRIVKHTAAEGKAKAEQTVETGGSVVSEAEAKVNLEAMASTSSDVSGTLSTVGKANAAAEGDAWFDIF
ncbi:MAG: hypothetical protein SGI91_14980 [Alphaproteobacteria bacterium]|jgi:hypothetical protein|nr:hypothetical protein [Alphaproteobacteria bacterium]